MTAARGVAAPFGARLAAAVSERESNLVLGIDPDPRHLWPGALPGPAHGDRAAERAAAAVGEHCRLLIAAAGQACVAVKLQLACFERLGAPGWAALQAVADHARAAGLLVIADAKRGDVPVTAAAYAQALLGGTSTPFGEVAGLGADAVTANPLLGADALAPLVEAARAAGAGVFVLVRTSNAGAADVQDLRLAGGGALWERLARLVAELGAPRPTAGEAPSGEARSGEAPSGLPPLADVGAVVGATAPEHLSRARELMPRAVFLLPGVGAQGGRVEDLAPAFAPGPAAGLVTVSRSIARAHETAGGEASSAAAREAQRLRAATWAVAAR